MARQCFQVGDRVVYTSDSLSDNLKVGDTGVVCTVEGSDFNPDWMLVGVRWDRYVEGHDCDGNCDFGFGWNVTNDEIELDQPDMVPDADKVDAFLRDMGV